MLGRIITAFGVFPHEQWATLNQKIGMLPMFPVPKIGDKSATMIGGSILGIPGNFSK